MFIMGLRGTVVYGMFLVCDLLLCALFVLHLGEGIAKAHSVLGRVALLLLVDVRHRSETMFSQLELQAHANAGPIGAERRGGGGNPLPPNLYENIHLELI